MDIQFFEFGNMFGRLEVVLMAMAISLVFACLSCGVLRLRKQSCFAVPVAEMLLRPLAVLLVDKLNRTKRAPISLIIRGAIVALILFCVAVAALLTVQSFLPENLSDLVFLVLLLSPIAPLFLGLELSKEKPSEGAYRHASQALNRNIIKVDAAGHRRNVFDVFALSLSEWIIAPALFYCIGGIGAAYCYCVISLLCRIAGEGKDTRLFLSVFWYVYRLLSIVPRMFASVIVILAGVFTPKAHPFYGVGVLLRAGGVASVYAHVLGVTLGGAYQDRHGQAIDRPWVGRDGATAKLSHVDVIRGCFLQGISIFFSCACCVLYLSYFSA